MFLVMGASLAQCMVLSHAETEFNELDSRSAEQHDDADWAFATLDEAYDPDDPAIKDLPEIDPSEIMFTDYDAEMDANSDGNSTGLTSRGLVRLFPCRSHVRFNVQHCILSNCFHDKSNRLITSADYQTIKDQQLALFGMESNTYTTPATRSFALPKRSVAGFRAPMALGLMCAMAKRKLSVIL